MSIYAMVATLIDNLQYVTESKDWRGEINWCRLGSDSNCWRCGGEFGKDLEPGSHVIHHIIPKSEGGPDTADNRSLLCGNCHNVVHRFYLPTGSIGKKRTRDGGWRRVANFSEGIQISQSIPAYDGSLSSCRECGKMGKVTGVSEGYWNVKGLFVFLDCPNCDAKFGIPFIGAKNAPEINLNAQFFSEMQSAVMSSAEDLPPELATRARSCGMTLVTSLREFYREMNALVKSAREEGLTDEEIQEKSQPIRQKYIDILTPMLPKAAELTDAIQAHKKSNPDGT